MARLVFGMPHREVLQELKRRGCTMVRNDSGREIWKTPKGYTFSLGGRKEISSADAMRMNQALEKSRIEEIRTGETIRRRAPEEKKQISIAYVPAKPLKPATTLREAFYRKLALARQKVTGG